MVRFGDIVRAVGFGLVAALIASAVAAQQAPLVGIEPSRATLDQIEASARRAGASVRALYDLQQQLGPLRDDLRAKLGELEPRLADVDARLQGLGAAPKESAAENATVAAERARLTQQRAELDGAIKQVQLLQTRADQLANTLADRRRSAYAESLLQRSPNVLDPFFWRDVAAAVPEEANRIAGFAQDWWATVRAQGVARATTAGIALAGLAALALGLARWWRRVALVARVHTRYGKAVAAVLVCTRSALLMPVSVLAVLELLKQFGLIPTEAGRIAAGLVIGVTVASLARAAGASLLAPAEPQRRIVDYDDVTAAWLFRHLVWGGRLFGAMIVLRALHRTIGAPAVIDDAIRMVFALAIGALLIHLLVGRRTGEEEPETRGFPGARLLAWLAIGAIAAALLAGYAALAAFIAGRVVFTVTLVATLYLLLIVTDAVINRLLSAQSPGGQTLARQLGVEPRRLGLIGKIASGVVRALFVLVILALALGRWEVAAADLFDAVRNAAFGIRIGDFTLSFGAVLGAVVLFLLIALLTRLIQRWLETEVMPLTAIEPSLQLSIVTILGYVGFIIAVVVALGELGIDPQKIALIAGALSVGIGFGLQSIVSNFVSGLILLAERPIRVGDQIVVKSEEGFVRRISVRATEIETFDKASVIIPNSELITGVVKNWTHANTLGRINIKIAVSYDSDPDRVIAALRACVSEHAQVLKQPPPAVLLTELGGSALTFEIFAIVPNLADRGAVKSDIQIAILRRLRADGIGLAPPQDVRLIGEAPAAVTSS